MLRTNRKEIVAINKQKKIVQAIYKGAYLVWQGIRSCFGGGMWFNDKPWLNDDGWKNS